MITGLVTRGRDETERLAELLAARLEGGETILLVGELGSGKTCFVRGLAGGLGADRRKVKSPSYNICHRYDGGRAPLEHFDAYFMREEEEFDRIGLEDFLFERHVVAVEWADRFQDRFGPEAVWVRFEHVDEETRRLTIRTKSSPHLLVGLDAEFRSGAGDRVEEDE